MLRKFKLATTPEEKDRIFRFRYQVYIEELKWQVNADHQTRMITDPMDDHGYLFYYESKDHGMIATARINLRRDGSLEFEKEYLLEKFKPFYPNYISTTSKFMIRKEYRRTYLTVVLARDLYQFTIQNKVLFDFLNTHLPLDKFYLRLGYRYYRNMIPHPEFGEAIPMVLVLNDLEHLQKINSPIVKVGLKEIKEKIDLESFFRKTEIKLCEKNIR